MTGPTRNVETIALDDPRLACEGLIALRREGAWWQPWRLPPDRVETAHAPALTERARMPAGARIALRTDATGIAMVLGIGATLGNTCVDIVVDGALRHRLPVNRGESTLAVELPAGDKEVVIWLPHWAETRVRAVTFTGHRSVVSAPCPGPRWITYGSSITHCVETPGPSETWPALVARRHGWHLTGLGFSAECHLDSLVARTMRDSEADLISMCLGGNIYRDGGSGPRTLAGAVSGFIETVRDGHPETPMVVITPIFAPEREQMPNITGMTLVDVRAQVAQAVETLMRLGDTRLTLIDGLEVMGAAEAGLLPDHLHPSPDGYRLMADRLGPRLRRALATGSGAAENVATT